MGVWEEITWYRKESHGVVTKLKRTRSKRAVRTAHSNLQNPKRV